MVRKTYPSYDLQPNMQAKRVLVAFCASRKFKLPGLKALFLAL